MAGLEFRQVLSGGAIRCETGGAITGTGRMGSREFLGGAVEL
jgi:hypothetical protein